MARAAKLDLSAFQQELAARLAAKTTQQVEQSRLGLACAGKQWLIRLADAGEVIAVPTMATVPLTRSWYLGISNIRGNLYSVIDFAGFLGEAIEPLTPARRRRGWCCSGRASANCAPDWWSRGCWVFSNLAELVRRRRCRRCAGMVRRALDRQGRRRWQEIDLALLAQDPGFLQVGL